MRFCPQKGKIFKFKNFENKSQALIIPGVIMSGANIREIIGRVDITSITANHTADDVFATPAGKVLALFDFFMLVFGILGNSIVLYGSKRYQAINIDRISTSLIEHLATAEILILVLHNLPIFLSLIFKSWVLGKTKIKFVFISVCYEFLHTITYYFVVFPVLCP